MIVVSNVNSEFEKIDSGVTVSIEITGSPETIIGNAILVCVNGIGSILLLTSTCV